MLNYKHEINTQELTMKIYDSFNFQVIYGSYKFEAEFYGYCGKNLHNHYRFVKINKNGDETEGGLQFYHLKYMKHSKNMMFPLEGRVFEFEQAVKEFEEGYFNKLIADSVNFKKINEITRIIYED